MQIRSLSEERNSAFLKLQALEDDNARLSSELMSRNAAVTRLEELNREMQGQLSVTLNKLHSIMLDEGDAKDSAQRAQREKAEFAAREQELVSRLAAFESSKHAEQSIHSEFKAVIERLEQEVIDVKRDRDSVFSELANSRQTTSSLEMMCSTVRSESERIRTSLMEHVEQLDSRVKTLSEEREKLLTSERDMKRKFEQSNELVMQYRAIADAARADLDNDRQRRSHSNASAPYVDGYASMKGPSFQPLPRFSPPAPRSHYMPEPTLYGSGRY